MTDKYLTIWVDLAAMSVSLIVFILMFDAFFYEDDDN